ncbi:MAG TPA: hypothetical protein DEG47_25145, partial [Cyanobacteria bacterium UBA11148]|nr:hypothetical protein [Cyanobacteria bacterium UBA11148]
MVVGYLLFVVCCLLFVKLTSIQWEQGCIKGKSCGDEPTSSSIVYRMQLEDATAYLPCVHDQQPTTKRGVGSG